MSLFWRRSTARPSASASAFSRCTSFSSCRDEAGGQTVSKVESS